MKINLILCLSTALLLGACASTEVVHREVRADLFNNKEVAKAYTARPTITFPANLALVHLQGSQVVTKREVETEKDLKSIAKLPGVENAVRINPLLAPQKVESHVDLREAAAKLQADALLLYSFDTVEETHEMIPHLTVLSLGILTNTKYQVTTSASALLMDTKTGFVYGSLEESSTRSGVVLPFFMPFAKENAGKAAKREAFEKLVEEFKPFWTRVHERYRK